MQNAGIELGPQTPDERRRQAYALRENTAGYYRSSHSPRHRNNGDESTYANLNFYASFTKGLPHDTNGEVDPAAYAALLAALQSGEPRDFESIPLGSANRPKPQRLLLVNPQAGLAFDLEGIDPHQVTIQPAYAFNSAGEIGEIAENYWMALCRDIPFHDYDTDATIQAAAADLSTYAQFDGPKEAVGGVRKVTPRSIFRGFAGDLVGPYLSQFMILPIPYGAQQTAPQLAFGLPDQDFMIAESDWLSVQRGIAPAGPAVAPLAQPHLFRNGRDLGQYVHIDELYQAYLNACLLMITPKNRGGFAAPLDNGNPYGTSQTQTGFGTLGEPNFKTIVTEVATRALKAVWFQKWFVHRRLRPEAFGGRLHFHFAHGRNYDFHAGELVKLQAGPLQRVHAQNNTWLLPMAFPEGCPVHPAYGAGHATVAGACVTVLKAMFREEVRLVGDLGIQPMVPNSAGTALVPYTGADAGQMTIGGELNKLAGNVGLGRDFAGVHWRSDYTESVKLGEQIALYFLQDYFRMFNEDVSCTVTRFDGTRVTIERSL
jgi:hypothetical protein